MFRRQYWKCSWRAIKDGMGYHRNRDSVKHKILLIIIVLFCLSACGKMGDPRPRLPRGDGGKPPVVQTQPTVPASPLPGEDESLSRVEAIDAHDFGMEHSPADRRQPAVVPSQPQQAVPSEPSVAPAQPTVAKTQPPVPAPAQQTVVKTQPTAPSHPPVVQPQPTVPAQQPAVVKVQPGEDDSQTRTEATDVRIRDRSLVDDDGSQPTAVPDQPPVVKTKSPVVQPQPPIPAPAQPPVVKVQPREDDSRARLEADDARDLERKQPIVVITPVLPSESPLALSRSPKGVLITLSARTALPKGKVRIFRSDFNMADENCETCPPLRREMITELSSEEIRSNARDDGMYAYTDRSVRPGFIYKYLLQVCNAQDVCLNHFPEAVIRFNGKTEGGNR